MLTSAWRQKSWDAIVVGAGPNGLTAAIILAQARHTVLVIEAQETLGGGVRSAALTLPGFVHDVCSSVYPLAVASPVFAKMPLAAHGFEWIYPLGQTHLNMKGPCNQTVIDPHLKRPHDVSAKYS